MADRARSALRAAAAVDDSPRAVLAELNRVLVGSRLGVAASLTAICLRFERRGPGLAVTLCVAGHPPALLRSADGSVTEVAAAGTMLGVLEDPLLADRKLILSPGSTLLLYTDGVTEARRGSDYYAERLFGVVAREGGRRFAAIPERVARDVRAFTGGTNEDDLAVLALRAAAPNRSRLAARAPRWHRRRAVRRDEARTVTVRASSEVAGAGFEPTTSGL